MAGKGTGKPAKRGVWRWLTAPFGLHGLTGFALWGFIFLSVLATGLGFADLRAAGTDNSELSALELSFTIATTLFVVSAMVVALHYVVAPGTGLFVKLLSFVFYLIFAMWSVGFGYGFFWKELAGQEFTERQFERAMVVKRLTEDFQGGLRHPEVTQKLTDAGFEVIPSDGPALGKYAREQFERWGAFVKRTGLKMEE